MKYGDKVRVKATDITGTVHSDKYRDQYGEAVIVLWDNSGGMSEEVDTHKLEVIT